MNVHDSQKLAGALEREGFSRATSAESADVVLLNTCSIREKAAEKFFSEVGRLRALKRARPDVVLGVCGCVAQEQGEAIFQRAPHVDFVVGPRAVASVPRLVRRLRAGDLSARRATDLESRDDSLRFPFEWIPREGTGPGKAFVTIIEGCNHRCSFCIVPKTRGREISRSMDDVLQEVELLAARGIREVEFLGQTVNAYRDAAGRGLAELLRAAAAVPEIERIRFTTSHPAQMTAAIVDAMAGARPKVCPYLHLPAQSGSSPVLRAMRRGYDRGGYLAVVDRLRAAVPGICFGTDIIVGFPGETDGDFAETLSLLETVGFDQVYAFAYSARPGTAAAELETGVPAEVAAERLAELNALQRRIQERRNAEWVGREVEVLVEGSSRLDDGEQCGRTPENRVVNFSTAASPGQIVRLRITRASAFSLRGEEPRAA